MIGTTLSHYTIEAELGRGGMGIVYRAKDTKLDRTVAIKILPSAALASKDDRERFYREAKSAAQLHHPNIASVFEIDEAVPEGGDAAEPRPFIAMEYIAGGTLQEKIQEKPLSLPDAVKIASQVAEALKAAHAKDIVHRDIKSANVMITEDGIAKVLDFGLAKTNQSTMLTRMGSTLGTVAYMSPEQARGQEVDGRTDLYSLGTMLYEMVAGRLPFAGEYEQAVVYSILNEPPEPLTSLRTGVPMQLEWIVNKLMAKDADYRYQTAADLLADLKALDLSGSGMTRRSMPAATAASVFAATNAGLPKWVYGAIAGALLIGAAAAWVAKPTPPETPTAVVSFPLDIEERLDRTGRHSVAISPNGEHVAYVTPEGIRVQRMNELGRSTLLVPNEDGTIRTRDLFFSPDSRWLAFEDDLNDRLMRVEVAGGSPMVLAELPGSLQGSFWAPSGDIYLGMLERGIGRLARGSGAIEVILAPDSAGVVLSLPMLVPDSRSLIYTRSGRNRSGEYTDLHIVDLESGTDRLLLRDASGAMLASTGHLVFASGRTLFANPFDPSASEWADVRIPVIENVWTGLRGIPQTDLSKEGTLLYAFQDGEVSTSGLPMAWVSPSQVITRLPVEEKDWGWPDISPDGRYIVAEEWAESSEAWDLWIIDSRDGTQTRLTSNGQSSNGVWAPDGKRIAHTDQRGSVLLRYVDDATRVDTLLPRLGRPTSWSRDGRYLIFDESEGLQSDRRLSYLDLETGKAVPFPPGEEGAEDGVLSPNGRWLAYEKGNESGIGVYVVPFPEGGEPRLVSTGLAFNAHWSADGTRIYYAYNSGGTGGIGYSEFNPDTGVSRFAERFEVPGITAARDWAVGTDGTFLVVLDPVRAQQQGTGSAQSTLRFVKGFDTLLRERLGSRD